MENAIPVSKEPYVEAEVQVLNFMPFLVWYVLPGLNLLTVCVVAPVLVLNLHGAAAAFSVPDPVGAAVLAVVIDFIMDAVKLSRFTPGYRAQKSAFHARIGDTLAIDPGDVAKVFDIIRADVRGEDPVSRTVELDHSRWVMINHTSKTFFVHQRSGSASLSRICTPAQV